MILRILKVIAIIVLIVVLPYVSGVLCNIYYAEHDVYKTTTWFAGIFAIIIICCVASVIIAICLWTYDYIVDGE